MCARPSLRTGKPESAPASVEATFYGSRNRARTHEFLRGPQQDVIRQYDQHHHEAANVAIELPTGTGKTTVGLAIAEWCRRTYQRPTAYLTLTNQLASQVLAEANRSGFDCADVSGPSGSRDPIAEGRFRTADAVAISTYSNMFNVNPIIKNVELVVLDDVHGGEDYVASMWSVSVSRSTNAQLYSRLATALLPAMDERQRRRLEDTNDPGSDPFLVDVSMRPACTAELTEALDAERGDLRYAWSQIRDQLDACLILVSSVEITIRPLIPPTWSHAPFAETRQRIFLSATLGSMHDLRRAYGIEEPVGLRAEYQHSGRRFIFVPEMYANTETASDLVTRTFQELVPRRALLLAPSSYRATLEANSLASSVEPAAEVLRADAIGKSLEPFTSKQNAVLALSRYDGIDLPHEDCRLLVMAGAPTALSPLERNLLSQWRCGPVLRSRLRTRLVQGLGRCTRGDTDYAVVFWLGQRLVDASSTASVIGSLPPDVQAEVKWGMNKTRDFATSPDDLTEMIRGLLTDDSYRAEADRLVAELREEQEAATGTAFHDQLRGVVSTEIRFAQRAWDGHWLGAYEAARQVADQVSAPELAGYRAWWWYLAAMSSCRQGETGTAADCLRKGDCLRDQSGFPSELSGRC